MSCEDCENVKPLIEELGRRVRSQQAMIKLLTELNAEREGLSVEEFREKYGDSE